MKCFEFVYHAVLVREAIAQGFGLHTLRLSIAACRMTRVVVVHGIVADLIVPTRGIAVGSPFGTTGLRVLIRRLLVKVSTHFALCA